MQKVAVAPSFSESATYFQQASASSATTAAISETTNATKGAEAARNLMNFYFANCQSQEYKIVAYFQAH